ncbi:TlpA family protein disulfide reductase [Chitinophaga silvatica]|uniref:TlpA family protein disulfide reductase n=1 Tax=Chitinophaga silvatica TaxID=2282649 RepID=A0A3E1Y307_9BACT|nr:TlpA disulfide reductase family protein [Chitinophaga silvatica]RFS19034.1 TlpA family protein disulfide reductase [Chitinophaga silvatica]
MRKFIWLALLMVIPILSSAQKSKTFLYHFLINDTLPQGTQIINKYYRIKISDKDKNGNRDLVCVLESANRVGIGDYKVNLTDTLDPTHINYGQLATMQMWHLPVHFQVNAQGVVSEILNEKELKQIIKDRTGIYDYYSNFLNGEPTQLNTTDLQPLFRELPASREIGYTWKKDDIEYKITEASKRKLIIQGKLKTESTDYQLDEEFFGGYPQTVSWKSIWQHKEGERGVNHYKVRVINPDTVFTVPDTAMFNTMFHMSGISDRLSINKQIDSTKLANFLALNDPKYLSIPKYKRARRQIIHMCKECWEQYKEELEKSTTSELQSDPSDLFNKLQFITLPVATSIEILNAFKAYPTRLDDWVDTQMSQRFKIIDDTTWVNEAKKEFGETEFQEFLTATKARTDSFILVLDQLGQSNDSLFQAILRPQYLWVKALRTKDKSQLLQLKQQFDSITTASFAYGKPAKYKLLFYDQLNKNGLNKEADSLLDRLIVDLKENQTDTAFWSRYTRMNDRKKANKLLLAHSYYLKYKRTLPENKEAALNFLAQAASYSPSSKQESPHEGFYDRHLLSASESYSPLFAEELNKIGKPELAIKVMAQQLQVNPNLMDSLERQFNRQFSGKSFHQFFKDVVVKGWTKAPDFKLKGLNSEDYQLSDYSGKWLLLDFWGSWCSPCREDLPNISKLVEEVNAGKHPNYAVLLVSCHEPLEITKQFLDNSHYNFPNAVSDSKIEDDYKVSGYPSKILVSPAGTMLLLPYGTDYANILNVFSSTYFKQQEPPTTKITNTKNN